MEASRSRERATICPRLGGINNEQDSYKTNYQHCRNLKSVEALPLQRTLTLGRGQPFFFAQRARSVMHKT